MTFTLLLCQHFCPLGILDEQQLVKVLKDKLTSNPCRNQGFVLDSFPKTYEQAKELFSGETLQRGSSCSGVRSTCMYSRSVYGGRTHAQLYVCFVFQLRNMIQKMELLHTARALLQVSVTVIFHGDTAAQQRHFNAT